ncbi:hypothetical protein CVT24_005358 [Panaeolus cyanescens]|uniref:DRBM domain-containing protein n=1 Tax=Panaeolus cyanescens TaxID=181874 RepID=A0A409Y942_9AGAR|nr:hypothetical protein CVT24_005358 [Panaeolus cyanescens]
MSELPPLPPVEGDMELLLDVYTHPSLNQPGAPLRGDYGDTGRLSDLGAKVFDMAVTYHLFAKKPLLPLEEIKRQREDFLSAAQADSWVSAYGLKNRIRISATEIHLLDVPEQMRTYFYTYVGALYIRNGHGPLLQNWVSKLIDPTYEADIVLPADTKSSIASLPPAYHSSSPPNQFAQSYATPPPPAGPPPPLPGSPPPNSMIPPSTSGMPSNMMSLITLALVNQTAAKKGVTISYTAVPQGPPHQPIWTVRCLINEQERGMGVGKSQKQAKEEAARQAWMAMGW